MSLITRRLSLTELSQQILEMAKTGVYRESVFEALHPLATKQQIREAIAHAKRFGLHSVANLRDPELGTYYQLDLVKYQTTQSALHSAATIGNDADLVQRITNAHQTLARMLAIAKSSALLLAIAGFVCLSVGNSQISLGCFCAAFSAAGIWAMQHQLTKN